MNETSTAPDAPSATADRPPARWFVHLNFVLLGAGFAWFAYIDAPITDGAMRLFALAVAGALLSIVAALRSGEAVSAPARDRSRRAAVWLFAVATALMLTAATLTLNLRGTDSDDEDTNTKVTLHARAPGFASRERTARPAFLNPMGARRRWL